MPSNRRLSVSLLDSMERQRGGSLGSGGPSGGVYDPVCISASTSQGTHLSTELFPRFHQGEGLSGAIKSVGIKGGSRASSPVAGVLQPYVCSNESLRGVAPHYRPVHAKQVCVRDEISNGDRPVGSLVSKEERLDDLSRSERCLSAGTYPSRQQKVSPFRHRRGRLSVPSPVFRVEDVPSGLYTGDGSGLSHFTFNGDQNFKIPGRLASAGVQSGELSLGKGQVNEALSGVRNSDQCGEIASYSHAGGDLFRHGDR